MKYLKVVFLGALIWAVMFALISAFLPSYTASAWVRGGTVIAAGVLSLIAAGFSGLRGWGGAFCTALTFVAVGLILDYLITRQYNPNIFYSKTLWAGYVLVFIAPFFRRKEAVEEVEVAATI